jgi:hypothetical protein
MEARRRQVHLSAGSESPSVAGPAQGPTAGFCGHRSSLGWLSGVPTGAWTRPQSSRPGPPHPQVASAPPEAQRPPAASSLLRSPAPRCTDSSVSTSGAAGRGPSPWSHPGPGGSPRGARPAREAPVLPWGAHLRFQVCSPGRGSSSRPLHQKQCPVRKGWQHRPQV